MQKLLCHLLGHRGATVSVLVTINGRYCHSHDYCEFCRQEYPPGVLL
jgi:hypothetical protein